jgi:hypothetical protein
MDRRVKPTEGSSVGQGCRLRNAAPLRAQCGDFSDEAAHRFRERARIPASHPSRIAPPRRLPRGFDPLASTLCISLNRRSMSSADSFGRPTDQTICQSKSPLKAFTPAAPTTRVPTNIRLNCDGEHHHQLKRDACGQPVRNTASLIAPRRGLERRRRSASGRCPHGRPTDVLQKV